MGLERGADDYLPKPYNPRELQARIKTILKRVESKNEPKKAEQNSLFEIKESDMQISFKGIPLTLTLKFFNGFLLLYYLPEKRIRTNIRYSDHN